MLLRICVALVLATVLASSAAAAVIGVNFVGGDGDNAANGASVGAGDFTGASVYNINNWNNVSAPPATGGPVGGLRDNFGVVTAASVSWVSNNTWDTNLAASNGNNRLMRGYLDTTDTSTTTVNVTGIPYASYDVVVYFDGDNGATSRNAAYFAASNGGYSGIVIGRDAASVNFAAAANQQFVQAFATDDPGIANAALHSTVPAGNFAVFRGVTGSQFDLAALATSSGAGLPPAGGLRAPIQGLQIVEAGVTHPVFFARNGTGGWNAYEVRRDAMSAAGAINLAAATTFPGSALHGMAPSAAIGHGVSITSAVENESVRRHIIGSSWIGLTDSTTYGGNDTAAVTNNQSGSPNPPPNTAPVAGQRGFGWVWARGRVDQGGAPVEPLVYQNWNTGEPNDAGANMGEDAVELLTTGLWNDNRSGEGTQTNQGNVNSSRDYVIEYDLNLASAPVIANLPTAGQTIGPGRGMFKVTTVRGWTNGTGQVLHTHQADAIVRSGAGTITTSDRPEIDLADPQSAGTGRFAGSAAFDQDTAADDNDFIVVAKAKVIVPPGQGGPWTVGVQSDDGFRLRFPGRTFTSAGTANAATNGTYVEGDTLEMPWPRGGADATSTGVVNLSEGVHDVELLFFERAGGGQVELFAAPGAHSSFFNIPGTRGSTFQLIGHRGTGASTTVLAPGEAVGGFNIREVRKNPNAIAADQLNNIDQANAALNAPRPTDIVVDYNAPFVNHRDPDNSTTINFPGDMNFQTNIPGDTNDIAFRATTTLRITAEDDYTFGFQGDDGSRLTIGNTPAGFFSVNGGASSQLFTVNTPNDSIQFNVNTGNSFTLGRIHLPVGDYPLTYTFWERGGGANTELFGAPSAKTALDSTFMLVGAQSFSIVDADGMQIVPEPSTWMIGTLGLLALGVVSRWRRAA